MLNMWPLLLENLSIESLHMLSSYAAASTCNEEGPLKDRSFR
jgi:hypothetical protein